MDRRRRLLGGVASLALAVCLISPAWSQSAPLANENPQAPSQGAAPSPAASKPAAAASQADAGAGPGAADYVKTDADAENQILPAKSYSGNRYVDLPAITPQSVGRMQPAWTFKISDPGPMEVAPLVWHGTMFVTSAHDHVYAIDAATGAQKWEFVDSPHVIAFAGNRGVALMGDKVFLGTLDGHMIALDAATGAKAWDVLGVDEPKNSFCTMAPVPYHNTATSQDMLLIGVSNGDWGGRGYVQAFDPKDGRVLWRWQTVPGPGEPGNDTWPGDTWKRGGASVWAGLAIDPASQTLCLDLGNPQPDFLGSVRPGANLFSNSMVALDISGPSTPKMKWYHHFIAHDTHDWDPSMPPVLFHGKAGGQEEELVAAGDKAGKFWVLDSGDGHLVSQTAASFQRNQNTEPSAAGNVACPNTNGGIEYNGGTYDPGTNAFFVPSVNECGFWKSTQQAVYISGQFYLGGIFPTFVGPNTGDMNAISIDSGVFNWRHHLDLPAADNAPFPALYTQAQAVAGKAVYAENCVSCHGADMHGLAAPAIAGTEFLSSAADNEWSLEAIRTIVFTMMPLNAGGSLSTKQYADVTAFILASNCLPAGATPFPEDDSPALDKVQLHPLATPPANRNALGVCPVG